jgi:NAD(P)H-nitrite reductase large subunit
MTPCKPLTQVFMLGECIEHRNQTFGLVEPLWGQAFICATHLAEHGSLTLKHQLFQLS